MTLISIATATGVKVAAEIEAVTGAVTASAILVESRRSTSRIDAEAAPPTDLNVTTDLGATDLRRTAYVMVATAQQGLCTLAMRRLPRERVGVSRNRHHAPRAPNTRSRTELPVAEKRRQSRGKHSHAPPLITFG